MRGNECYFAITSRLPRTLGLSGMASSFIRPEHPAANFMVNVAIDRSAHLTENYVDQKLTFTQYALSMTSTVGYGLTGLVVAGRVATGVSKAVGMGIWGETAGAATSGVAYTFIQKGGDVVTYQLSDGKAGQSLQSLKDNWTQVTTDMALGAGLGMLPGLLGRVPFLNAKIMWNSPTVESSLRFRLVQPVMATDARGYRFTLADSSGGDILAAAGGKITRGGHSLDIPAKGAMTFAESEIFLDDASAVLRALLDDKASLREQAYQAAQISNSLLMAARNGLQDANLAARLNFTLPPSTFKQMEQKYAKDFGGDAMYKKIIADAEDQLHRLSCFVAGTLVHTQEGLRPIEQIKAGDYVLSKPEDGNGEVSYKRVVKTFESESDELYYVSYFGGGVDEFLIVTGNHPFWVINQDDSLINPNYSTPVNAWLRASELSKEGNYSLMLHDGRKVMVDMMRKILQIDLPDFGWVANDFLTENFMQGHIIDFRGDRPIYCHGQIAGAPSLQPLNIESYGGKIYNDFYEHEDPESSAPLKRKVYNLEVEDNHTYFVGEQGVWVHNTCAIENLKGEKVFFSVKEYNAYVKANPGVENSLLIDNNNAEGEYWSRLQRDTEGTVTDAGTNNNLYAYTLKGKNPFAGGMDYTKFGDGIMYIADAVGNRVKSNALMDVKQGRFGASTKGIEYYTNSAMYNDAWRAANPTDAAKYEASLDGFISMFQRNSAQIAQRDMQPLVICVELPEGVELGAKAITQAIMDTPHHGVRSSKVAFKCRPLRKTRAVSKFCA